MDADPAPEYQYSKLSRRIRKNGSRFLWCDSACSFEPDMVNACLLFQKKVYRLYPSGDCIDLFDKYRNFMDQPASD